jgi:hypothetical protein
MLKARINGLHCILFYEERIPLEKAPLGYPFMYHIRHDEDDWTCPISIEKFVVVNFFGTIFMGKPLDFGSDNYIEIEQFRVGSNFMKLKISKTLFTKMLGL